jgi:hypothetical protein
VADPVALRRIGFALSGLLAVVLLAAVISTFSASMGAL